MTQRAKKVLKRALPAPIHARLRRVHRHLTGWAKGKRKPPYTYPTIFTDDFGIRFIYYPWETLPLSDLLSREFYKPEFYALKKLINGQGVIIDVGANIGLHCTYMSNLLHDGGSIHAFEPVPYTYRMLRETLALNQVDNVKGNMMALGSTQGCLEMNVFDEQYSAWNTFGHPEFDDVKPRAVVDVQTTTLDAYCAENNITQVDFLKIDVEGYELEVLKGARGLLSSGSIDALSFEISEIPLKGVGCTAQEIFDILRGFGYQSYKFNVGTDQFEGPFLDSSDFYENYYASTKDLRQL